MNLRYIFAKQIKCLFSIYFICFAVLSMLYLNIVKRLKPLNTFFSVVVVVNNYSVHYRYSYRK